MMSFICLFFCFYFCFLCCFVRLLIVNFFECLIFICHGQLDFDDRETVFRCPVLLLHGCQPIDLNGCFSLICISYVELSQRKQINLLTYSFNTNIRHGRKQVRRNDTKINQGALSHRVSVPGVPMNSFVLRKCVHHAQPIGGTELQ